MKVSHPIPNCIKFVFNPEFVAIIYIVNVFFNSARILSSDVNEEENTVDININVNELLGKEQGSGSFPFDV